MKEMSDKNISDYFKKDSKFGGVINKNDLNKLDNKVYIFNIGHKSGQGSHWQLISNLNPNYVYFFDSFATGIPEHMKRLARQTGKPLIENKTQLQELSSNSCGEWTVMIAKQLLKGLNPNQIIKMFSNRLQDNETKLKTYFRTL
jgi:hypothetical protein